MFNRIKSLFDSTPLEEKIQSIEKALVDRASDDPSYMTQGFRSILTTLKCDRHKTMSEEELLTELVELREQISALSRGHSVGRQAYCDLQETARLMRQHDSAEERLTKFYFNLGPNWKP